MYACDRSSSAQIIHRRKIDKSNGEYTTDADFDMGTFVNVNHKVPGQLQLDAECMYGIFFICAFQ